ncbi:Proteasome subunit alpha type-3 [Zancudomyces culisetae]|uniref:Proteasome subunit alpha type-3 n=1 Tax=Zancudomyces culisetae TaxID=1213189 RepID=A0A1R1PK83_ZANCU|nr:Proteasome subunit alpha type-3 [Zancudomyces culisetae]|eukprot:OMH81292.1 Proteasome subunit alpha type-3 [Zancudomyces culisetae]
MNPKFSRRKSDSKYRLDSFPYTQSVFHKVGTGWIPDVKQLVSRAREEVLSFQNIYQVQMPPKQLAERLGMFIQAYTLYSSVRPFGASPIMACMEGTTPHLYMFETSGAYYGYKACAAGKAKQLAKTEMEKLDLDNLSMTQLAKEAARIIYTVHDNSKDSIFELELAWICPESNYVFSRVPKELFDEAVQYAEGADDDMDDEDL